MPTAHASQANPTSNCRRQSAGENASPVSSPVPTDSIATLLLPHARLLGWVSAYRATHRQAPPLTDVVAAFGAASLEWLAEMQRLECVIITSEERVQLVTDICELPVVGQVAAGVPIEAIELRQEQLSLPLDYFPERPTYLLRVKGDSMINAGIHDGDLIAIKKSGHAREGAIIVARVNNEVTVKRLRIGTHYVSLLPENDAYQPICVAPADLVVEGVFVGVVRQPRGLH